MMQALHHLFKVSPVMSWYSPAISSLSTIEIDEIVLFPVASMIIDLTREDIFITIKIYIFAYTSKMLDRKAIKRFNEIVIIGEI